MADVLFFTLAELQDRVSRETVRECYDDNNDGDPDDEPIRRLILDATSRVTSALIGVYPDILTFTALTVPNELKRLALDAAFAYMAQRHEEYVRRDYVKLLTQLEIDLNNHRIARSQVDSATVTPANVGGVHTSASPNITTVREDGSGGMGDF